MRMGPMFARGHHRGRGHHHGFRACPRRIARFIEPCLLLLLREEASHGYQLADGLQRFGFASDGLDVSVVYRALRAMEREGWVTSDWDTSGAGAPRRVYRLTTAGKAYLDEWMEDLRRTRDELDQLLAVYDGEAAA
ncbi:MAG: helix-turn-helix transcriptional regulator [Anaerolineae bacterium]